MINIYEAEFRRADLNLLVVFAALMRERSVTRAAEELRLSQAAVSAALGRLRRLFGDQLFVRTRTGMEPTPRALTIARQTEPALRVLHGAITGADQFAPERSERMFTLGMSDDIEAHLMPLLVGRAHMHPGLRFVARQAHRSVVADMLDQGEIDLGIAVAPTTTAEHRQETLFTSGYACVYDAAQLDLPQPLTRHDYLAHPHVLVSHDGRRGIVDDLLDAQGLTRDVLTATTHFAGAVVMLKSVPAIATIPGHAATAFSRVAGLTVSPPPIPMPDYAVSMVWHSASADDAAHAWLRQTVRELARPSSGSNSGG